MGHREQLLAAAVRLLKCKGYGATTARDLVAESNTNLASIGYHFGSKEALLNEAIGQAMEEWSDWVSQRALTEADTPLERLMTAMRTIVDLDDDALAVFGSALEAIVQSKRSPELHQQLSANFANCWQHIADRVQESAPAGEISREDALTLAAFLMALTDGFAIQRLAHPEAVPSGDQLISALGNVFAMVVSSPVPVDPAT